MLVLCVEREDVVHWAAYHKTRRYFNLFATHWDWDFLFEELSFELTNIICVIHDTIQMESKKNILNKVPSSPPEGAYALETSADRAD